MRQLQLHEYLALLDGGAEILPVDDSLAKSCMKQAQSLWPQLRIRSWKDHPRRIECVTKCQSSEKLLVHVSADWKNCFLILVVPPRKLQAEAYLLFDIGAEYGDVRLICPNFELDQVADEAAIRRFVPKLRGADDPFAILEIGDGTYIQASADDGMYDVEHQLVSLSSHYCLDRRVDAETVINMFLSYAFGKKEWAREYSWKKMEL